MITEKATYYLVYAALVVVTFLIDNLLLKKTDKTSRTMLRHLPLSRQGRRPNGIRARRGALRLVSALLVGSLLAEQGIG